LSTELDENIDDVKFKNVESSGSCKISEIENILFGGISSRFWMLRKHIMLLNKMTIEKEMPFFAW